MQVRSIGVRSEPHSVLRDAVATKAAGAGNSAGRDGHERASCHREWLMHYAALCASARRTSRLFRHLRAVRKITLQRTSSAMRASSVFGHSCHVTPPAAGPARTDRRSPPQQLSGTSALRIRQTCSPGCSEECASHRRLAQGKFGWLQGRVPLLMPTRRCIVVPRSAKNRTPGNAIATRRSFAAAIVSRDGFRHQHSVEAGNVRCKLIGKQRRQGSTTKLGRDIASHGAWASALRAVSGSCAPAINNV